MTNRLNYMPQLDAIRAVAVLMVIGCHWIGGIWSFGGGAGVLLFYVLSGFLISRILLVAKYEESGNSKLSIIKKFIFRRSLRIFPIYYLFIFFFFIIGDPYMRSHIVWYATYCSNIYFFINGLDTAMYGHTWSLAVEEQFYLIWPWLILFIPKRYELKLILILILTAILFRYLLDSNGYYGLVLTPSNFDAFGLGALLAYLKLNENIDLSTSKLYSFIKKSANVFVLTTLLGLSLFFFWWPPPLISKKTADLLFQFVFSVFSMIFICKTADGFKGVSRYFFDNSLVLYIGKISYGIYLYHKIIPWAFSYTLAKFGYNYNEHGVIQYCIQFLALFLIAYISWKLIEEPINRLKQKFAYT